MKNILKFDMDGSASVFVETIDDESYGMERASRSKDGFKEAQSKFADAMEQVKPAVETILKTFKDINTPDEIALEFGVKFAAKAGAVIASVDSEATLKVSLKWQNKKE